MEKEGNSPLPAIIRKRHFLSEGKLPVEVLDLLLRALSTKGNNIVVPPSVGVDVGVTRTKGTYLVTSSDPITGTTERMGWHAVNVSANDVATSGIMPDGLSVISLFPSGSDERLVSSTIREINSTAGRLGITVTGGHTEITPGLHRPIIMVTCFGSGDKFVTASMAKENDAILMTKTAGIEGTSILSRLRLVGEELEPLLIKRARNIIRKLSILPEARLAFSTGKVHAMHDTTEGGTIGCLVEMSLASKLGFELDVDSVAIDRSTREITELLRIDALKLIGSGSLIISCSPKAENEIISRLAGGKISCTRIGTFRSKKLGHVLNHNDGRSSKLTELSVQDELWPALSKYGKLS
jgi:hydrogenase expression/formation protein HypE